MPESAVVAPVAPVGPAPSAESTSSTPSTPATSTDSKAEVAPKSVKLDLGDGPEDFQLDEPATKAEPEFRFDQLDAIKDSHTDLYKTLKAELSKAGRFGKAGEKIGVKTPEDFATHAGRVDKIVSTIGRTDGKRGLDAIESTIGELSDVLYKAQSGDDGVLTNWFKDNPTGMADMTTKAMAKLATVDPAAWSAEHAKVAWATLAEKDAAGTSAIDALNQMYEAVSNNPEARKLLERVAHTVNQISQASSYKPDPAQGLVQKEAQLKQRETEIWNKQTDMEVEPIIQNSLRKGLSSLTTELKRQLTPEERTEFLAEATKSFYSYAGKDQEFMRQFVELRKNGDREGIKSLVGRSKMQFAKQALKDLYRTHLLNREAVREDAASKQEANGGSATVGGKTVQMAKYTGKMSSEGYPLATMDYARMNREGIQAMDRQMYIVGKKELFSW